MLPLSYWSELTRRGFLTPPDCLVVIWCQLLFHLLFYLCKRNKSSRFYSADTLLSVTFTTLLTALCQCPKTNYKGLIGSIHSNSLPTSSSGYDSLPAAEDMSHNDCQKRTLFSDNAISKCLKSVRQCFTSRHSG